MYVTSKQVDQAAEVIEAWVRSWLNGETRSPALIDACIEAANDVCDLWGLDFRDDDSTLNEKPRMELAA